MGREANVIDGPGMAEVLLALGVPNHTVCFILEKSERREERVEVVVSGLRALNRERTRFEIEGSLPPFLDARGSQRIDVPIQAEHIKLPHYSPHERKGLLVFEDGKDVS